MNTCKNHPALSHVTSAAITPSASTAPNITGTAAPDSGIVDPPTFGIGISSDLVEDGDGDTNADTSVRPPSAHTKSKEK